MAALPATTQPQYKSGSALGHYRGRVTLRSWVTTIHQQKRVTGTLPSIVALARRGDGGTERLKQVAREYANPFPDRPTTEPSEAAGLPSAVGGVVSFNIKAHGKFSITVHQQEAPSAQHTSGAPTTSDPFQFVWLELQVEAGRASLWLQGHSTKLPWLPRQLAVVKDKEMPALTGQEKVGLESGVRVTYWLSFDRSHLTVKYGKGYHMEQTTLLPYDFLAETKDPKDLQSIKEELFGTGPKMACLWEDSNNFQGVSDVEPAMYFDRFPLTVNPPPFVLDSAKISMFDLDNDKFTFSSNLPAGCKVLYDNVTAANVDLDWPSGVGKYGRFKLSDAIAYSLKTKGCLLYNKLEEKAGVFGPDQPAEENYLRVTLGQSRGNSPGIPYVLEIWPGGYFSPIHNHGNAYAVIKVLFGGLDVKVFNKLRETTHNELTSTAPEPSPLQILKIKAGDVIFISPNWYQAHKLENLNEGHVDRFCATVQCYQYGDDDNLAWPYFDYLEDSKDTKIISEFDPDSDFQFSDMREKVMEEYFKAMSPTS